MSSKRSNGYMHSTFIAMHFSRFLFYFVSLSCVCWAFNERSRVPYLFTTLFDYRWNSVFYAPVGTRQILVCNDRQQHTLCSGIFVVLVHYALGIPCTSISLANGSIPVSHCGHWVGLCAKSNRLSFWVGLECFSHHDTSLLRLAIKNR